MQCCCYYRNLKSWSRLLPEFTIVQLTHMILDAMLLLLSESEESDPDSYRDAQKWSLLTWSSMQCCCKNRNLKSLFPTHTAMYKKCSLLTWSLMQCCFYYRNMKTSIRLIPECTKVELTHMILDAMLLLLSESEKFDPDSYPGCTKV